MARSSDAEIQERLASSEGWRRGTPEGDGASVAIERDFELSDFAAALAFVNRVGELAERANHHPDILLHGYKRVRLTLSTHSEGGLTAADFELASQIDGLL